MKKLVKVIATSFSVLLIFSVLPACSLLSSKKDTYVDVQIQHSESAETVSFYTGSYASQIKVTPDYVEDKILLGYYDTIDDSGSMYFDYLGKFTMSSWSTSYPTKLYAVYEDLDASKTYTSFIKRDENPYSAAYGYSNWLKWQFSGFSAAAIKDAKSNEEYTHDYAELAKFIYSNGNKKIKLTFHFTAKQICDDCELKLKHKILIGDEYFNEEQVALSQSWNTFSSSVEIYAKQLKGSEDKINYITLLTNPNSNVHLGDLYTMKNIYYTVSIVD